MNLISPPVLELPLLLVEYWITEEPAPKLPRKPALRLPNPWLNPSHPPIILLR